MLRRRCLLLRGAAAVVATPIGTPLAQGAGGNGGGSSASYTFVTSADVPAGAHLFVMTSVSNSTGLTSVGDSVNGATGWTLGTAVTIDGGTFRLCYRQQASLLPAGTTITVTHASASGNKAGLAFSVTGLDNASLVSLAMAGTFGTSNTPSFTSGTFGNANTLAMGFVFRSGGTGDSYTAASPFTGLANVGSAGAGSADLHADYSIRSSTAAVTLAPTVVTSRNWAAMIIGLKGL